MGELKPCPFCGAAREEVGLYDHTRLSGHSDGWNVRCYVCHVETAYQDTCAEAIAAWNRRPDSPSAGEWMPIETAPKDGRDILLAGVHPLDRRRQFVGGWWAAADDWSDEDGRFIKFEPTHWRPLPAPPQADGGEG